jgi:pimeloyl-ACP methyl ester carboxylesterase
MAMTASDHNKLLGTLLMVRGGLLTLIGIFMSIGMGGMGMFVMNAGHRHDDHVGGAVMMAAGIVGGIVMVLAGLFDLYTGSSIRQMKPVGRTLGVVASALMLLSFPLGTALGIYGLWFLCGDMGKALYAGTPAAMMDDPTPPPPNSWA